MKDLAGFTPQEVALITAAFTVYALLSWAPVIWPLAVTHKQRATFPRRWLFAFTILALAYGTIVAFLTILTIPLTAYGVFIAPQLSVYDFHLTDGLLRANNFVVRYWWLLLPPALLLNTIFLVRKLLPAWPSICTGLAANNSFKPKPLRGSA